MVMNTEELGLLVEAEEELKREFAEVVYKLGQVHRRLAVIHCPYKVGDRLVANRGLGVNGLRVESVEPPEDSCVGNRWIINTFAFSKAGELTKRGVAIEECDMLGNGGLYELKKVE